MLSPALYREGRETRFWNFVRQCAWLVAFALTVSTIQACVEVPKPTFDRPLQLGGRTVGEDVLNHGESVYGRYCSSCHGNNGSGQGPRNSSTGNRPPDLRTGKYSHTQNSNGLPSQEELVGIIRNGVPNRGMPPWPGLSDSDVNAVANYLMTLSSHERQK